MLIVMLSTIGHGGENSKRELDNLLAAISAGDQNALAELYSRTRAAVYAMALSILKNTHDAQDVTHDVYVRVYNNASNYHPRGSAMAWLLTITRNLARMRLRSQARIKDLAEGEWNAIPADSPGISDEDRLVLQMALSSLTDEERQIIMLHSAAGLKHREIASLLEIPLATVLSKYHRSLKKLRNFMKGDDRP